MIAIVLAVLLGGVLVPGLAALIWLLPEDSHRLLLRMRFFLQEKKQNYF